MTTIKINGADVEAREIHKNDYTAESLFDLRYALAIGLVELEIALPDGSRVYMLDMDDVDHVEVIDDYINKTYDSDDDYRRRNGLE